MGNPLSGPVRLLMVEFECSIRNVLSAALLAMYLHSVSKTLCSCHCITLCDLQLQSSFVSYCKTLGIIYVTHFSINLFIYLYFY